MSRHAEPAVAVLDANVLYPFLVRDLLLSFAHEGLFRAHWSPQIMEEWTRNLIVRRPEREEQIRRTERLMNEAFPEALIEGHQALVGALDLPDPEDRHVLAAAIKAGAQVIVTENVADFPTERLGRYEIEARSADDFLSGIFELYSRGALSAVRQMRARYSRPPLSGQDLLIGMKRAGLVRTAAGLKPHIDALQHGPHAESAWQLANRACGGSGRARSSPRPRRRRRSATGRAGSPRGRCP